MPVGMVLTEKRIVEYLADRKLIVDPLLDKDQIDSASIDLRLDNYFMEFKTARTADKPLTFFCTGICYSGPGYRRHS